MFLPAPQRPLHGPAVQGMAEEIEQHVPPGEITRSVRGSEADGLRVSEQQHAAVAVASEFPALDRVRRAAERVLEDVWRVHPQDGVALGQRLFPGLGDDRFDEVRRAGRAHVESPTLD